MSDLLLSPNPRTKKTDSSPQMNCLESQECREERIDMIKGYDETDSDPSLVFLLLNSRSSPSIPQKKKRERKS